MLNILYRPVGVYELEKIALSGLKLFPPRLPEQPIFYPVLNKDYAIQIARDWNTKDEKSGFCGFITCFEVEVEYLNNFEVNQVGARNHKELWIPSNQLSEFNSKIKGVIQIIDSYYGDSYKGIRYDFKNKNIDEQLDLLENMF